MTVRLPRRRIPVFISSLVIAAFFATAISLAGERRSAPASARADAARELHLARLVAEDAWTHVSAGSLAWRARSIEAGRSLIEAARRFESESDSESSALFAPGIPPAAADRQAAVLAAHRARARRIERLLPGLGGKSARATARALLDVLEDASDRPARDSRSSIQIRHVRRIPARDSSGSFRELDDVRLGPRPDPRDLAPPSAAIAGLAANLPPDATPASIAAWVRRSTVNTPFHAEAVGADGCLRDRRCSAFDSAALLAGLLRARGVPARLAYGTVEADGEPLAAMLLEGDSVTVQEALDALHLGGVPASVVDGKTRRLRFEHAWVRARVKGLWVDFDPTFDRSTTLPRRISKKSERSDIDPAVMLAGYLSDPSNRTPIGADFLPAFPASQDSGTRGGPTRIPANWRLIVRGGDLAEVPAAYRGQVALTIGGDVSHPLIDLRIPLADVMATGVLLYPAPHSDLDRRIAKALGDSEVPPHLITATTVVSAGGRELAALPPFPWGTAIPITITLLPPNGDPVDVHALAQTGAPAAISIVPFAPGPGWLASRWRNADAAPGGPAGLARLFAATGAQFFADVLDESGRLAARADGRRFVSPSTVIVGGALHAPSGLARAPLFADPAGLFVDVGRLDQQLLSRPGARPVAFEVAAGAALSAWEGRALEIATGMKAVSTVAAAKAAAAAGGAPAVLRERASPTDLAGLSPHARTDIRRALESDLLVVLPRAPQKLGEWLGESYVVLDPRSGRGAYLIRGGLRGAVTSDRAANVLDAVERGADPGPVLEGWRRGRAGRALLAREGWPVGPAKMAGGVMTRLLSASATRVGLETAPPAGPWPGAGGTLITPDPGDPIAVHGQGIMLWIGRESRVLDPAVAKRLGTDPVRGFDPTTRIWIGPTALGPVAKDGEIRLLPLPARP